MTTQHDDIGLLNIFAHDLKTPISAIRHYIEFIENAGDLNDQQRDFFGKVQNNVGRMEDMINQLLDYVRTESSVQLRIVDCRVYDLVADALEHVVGLAEQQQVRINVDIDQSLSPIQGDPNILPHVFSNLLTNAVKYNEPKGEVFVTARTEGAYVRVDVRDTGEGISPDEQEKIFDRFYRIEKRRKPRTPAAEGSGLGLSIVKVVVQKHGGSVNVLSTPGQGSTFVVRLPRADMDVDGVDNASPRRDLRVDAARYTPTHHEVPREPLDGVDDNLQDYPDHADNDSQVDNL